MMAVSSSVRVKASELAMVPAGDGQWLGSEGRRRCVFRWPSCSGYGRWPGRPGNWVAMVWRVAVIFRPGVCAGGRGVG